MKKHCLVFFSLALLLNSPVNILPKKPNIDIIEKAETTYNKQPASNNGDYCVKWINQLPRIVIDIDGKQHFHPLETICYKRYSQRHLQ